MTILVRDDFQEPRPAGRALGPARGGDPARAGRDAEGIIGVDGGALRIAPPITAGWGRTCLDYGPFPNEPGLAFSVLLLNGHNTSQSEVMADTLRSRLQRWARGSGTVPVATRLLKWLVSGRVRRTARQVLWWRAIAAGSTRVNLLDENLAVGFYPVVGDDPLGRGAGFVMHADGPRNGELWTGANGSWAPAVLGVQNIPIQYVAIVLSRDVLLGASSLPGAHGLGAHPEFRPLAVVRRPVEPMLHAGVQQSVLGQIGFRADTRIRGVRVARLSASCVAQVDAFAADEGLSGSPLAGRRARAGGAWRSVGDHWRLEPGLPAGLLRFGLDPALLGEAGATVIWRADDAGRRWELTVTPSSARLAAVDAEGRRELAAEAWQVAPSEVQVLDDGREISVLAAGHLVFGRRFEAGDGVGAMAVGLIGVAGCGPSGLCALEAWPRALTLPAELVSGRPWQPAPGVTAASDPLTGPAGDLDGRALPVGGRKWRRLRGRGVLAVTGEDGARWQASAGAPLPERTIYTIDWDDPGHAELEVTLTPPGTGRGQREHGTAGFCLWQDSGNYLLINTWLDDCYAGASLSSFFSVGGFEDIYDAVWTNVGDRIAWGRPLRLKLVSDGLHYTVSLDGEPVLHRSLADVYPGCGPLRIRKVGLLGNWEWGADTGSRFADFRAAARGDRG